MYATDRHLMMRSSIIVILFFSIFHVSCSGNREREKADEGDREEAGRTVPQNSVRAGFPFPDIPSVLTSPEGRKAYLLRHYWDGFNFADSALVNSKETEEQGLADYLSLLSDETVDSMLAVESMEGFCSGMERYGYSRTEFMKKADSYLYNPESPYYDERIYRIYLERMLRSNWLDKAEKSTLRFRLQLASRNNPGEKATSFTYSFPDGSRNTLERTSVKGDWLLLVFYDPECHNCHSVLQRMKEDIFLKEMVSEGLLTVLAVYTEGDGDVWKRTLPDMPDAWITGNDHRAIQENVLYDLKAMPTLYLLDKEKKVVLKDAPYEKIRERLLCNGR